MVLGVVEILIGSILNIPSFIGVTENDLGALVGGTEELLITGNEADVDSYEKGNPD